MNRSMTPHGWGTRTALFALTATLAAFTLSACDRMGAGKMSSAKEGDSSAYEMDRKTTTAQPMSTPSQDTAAAKAATANSSNDAAISESVNAALRRDPELAAVRITVDTVDGKVALRGDVPNPQARDRAVQIARTVAGVREVDNQLGIGKG